MKNNGVGKKNLVLGLDFNPSCIGWALVRPHEKKIVATGVRVFKDISKKEETPRAERRKKRLQRRTYARYKKRRNRLEKVLRAAGLLPTPNEFHSLRAQNPYELRDRALNVRLELFEVGRAIFHLNQRRGYQSDRKGDSEPDEKKSEMLDSIARLRREIKESGHRTVGQCLAAQYRANGNRVRIRKQYTERVMYKEELRAIWEKQKTYYPELLTEELYSQIYDAVFYQRDMYFDKKTIGKCRLEKDEDRCPQCYRTGQRFRMLQEVNELKYLDYAKKTELTLCDEQRALLIGKLMQCEEMTFAKIRRLFNLKKENTFNLERGGREEIKGMVTDVRLIPVFGEERWNAFSEEIKDEIIKKLFNPNTKEEKGISDEEIVEIAVRDWGLENDEAKELLRVSLPKGRFDFSEKAMRAMMPFLECGMLVMGEEGKNCAMTAAGYLRPDQEIIQKVRFLKTPPYLSNPVVNLALFEFRKLMNAIIKKYASSKKSVGKFRFRKFPKCMI